MTKLINNFGISKLYNKKSQKRTDLMNNILNLSSILITNCSSVILKHGTLLESFIAVIFTNKPRPTSRRSEHCKMNLKVQGYSLAEYMRHGRGSCLSVFFSFSS